MRIGAVFVAVGVIAMTGAIPGVELDVGARFVETIEGVGASLGIS